MVIKLRLIVVIIIVFYSSSIFTTNSINSESSKLEMIDSIEIDSLSYAIFRDDSDSLIAFLITNSDTIEEEDSSFVSELKKGNIIIVNVKHKVLCPSLKLNHYRINDGIRNYQIFQENESLFYFYTLRKMEESLKLSCYGDYYFEVNPLSIYRNDFFRKKRGIIYVKSFQEK